MSLQTITRLDAGLDGRPRSTSISANQIREFGSSQSLLDRAI